MDSGKRVCIHEASSQDLKALPCLAKDNVLFLFCVLKFTIIDTLFFFILTFRWCAGRHGQPSLSVLGIFHHLIW